MSTKIEGNLNASGMKVAIITGRFNDMVTTRLTEASIDCLVRHGADRQDITEILVPGAYEMPLIADKLAASKKYDAVICNGAVIRGDTPHFDQVVNASTSGIANASIKNGLPVIYGILTTDNVEQAFDRAGVKAGNKGWDCAETAIEMVNLLKLI